MPDEEPKRSPEDEGAPGNGRNPWVQVARYSHLAFALPGATFAGWLLGAGMDKWLKTTWINKVGVALGVIAGFVELTRGFLRFKDEG